MLATLPILSRAAFRVALAAATAAALALALLAAPAQAQWPTSCVELNDTVERQLGRTVNVGIYQRVFGAQAEQACQSDHRADVQAVFAWAIGGADATSPAAPLAWPTSCVALNDIVEADLGNAVNVGIYQRVFGAQAETGCRNDHRADVRAVFAWAIPPPEPPPPPPPVPSTPSPMPTSAAIGEVLTLAASPFVAQDGTIWLGTSTGGVLRSNSSGAGFQQVIGGLPNLTVNAILPSPNVHIDGVVLAATNAGIARSTDGGHTWSAAAGPPASRIGGLATSPRFQRDGVYYAVADAVGLLRSSDGGATWAAVPAQPAFGLPVGTYLGMATSLGRADHLHIFAWTSTTLLVSNDAGNKFRSMLGKKALPDGLRISTVGIHPEWRRHSTLWVGSELHGLYRTTDGGKKYHRVLQNPDNVMGRINVIAMSPVVTRDGTIAIGTARNGVYLSRSSDAGNTVADIGRPGSWHPQSVNLKIDNVRGLAFSNAYAQDRTLFASGETRLAFTHTAASEWFTYPDSVGPTS